MEAILIIGILIGISVICYKNQTCYNDSDFIKYAAAVRNNLPDGIVVDNDDLWDAFCEDEKVSSVVADLIDEHNESDVIDI